MTTAGDGVETRLLDVNDRVGTGQRRKYEARVSRTAGITVAEVSTFTPEARPEPDVQGVVGMPLALARMGASARSHSSPDKATEAPSAASSATVS